MTAVLVHCAALPLYLYGSWGLFVLVIGLLRAWKAKRLGPWQLALALPWLAFGVALDVAANCTLAVVVFAELPHEFTVTRRLKRYMTGEAGWRRSAATWVCVQLLDPFDPSGGHC